MRIGINGRSIAKRQLTGIGRYTAALIRGVSLYGPAHQYVLYLKKRSWNHHLSALPVRTRNVSVKYDWFKRGVARMLGAVDLYHAPSFEDLPDVTCPIVVTIQDLVYKAFPDSHTPETLRTTERQMAAILRRASTIICPSQHTAGDLQRFLSVTRERVCCVYPAVDAQRFYRIPGPECGRAISWLRRRGIRRPFVLFVGTIEPRKNLANILRAFAHLRAARRFPGPLVVAGMEGWQTEGVRELVASLHLREQVAFLGYVSDDELRWLYNLTEVLAFPSLYEGFGFPLIEGFSCGAAVVTSNLSSCPEVAQEAAVVVDPRSPEAIGQGIGAIIEDNALRAALQAKALARAAEFTLERMAEQTLAVYEKACQLK